MFAAHELMFADDVQIFADCEYMFVGRKYKKERKAEKNNQYKEKKATSLHEVVGSHKIWVRRGV